MNTLADEVYLVHPTLPTTLPNIDKIPVREPCADVFGSNHYGLVFAGSLHLEQFRRALSATLQLYPQSVGRLNVSSDGEWSILLMNEPMPLTLATVLPHLNSASLNTFHPTSSAKTYIDHLSLMPSGESPLAKIKLTYWPLRNENSLFLSWSNVLGNEEAAHRFLHTLHRLYICQPPPPVAMPNDFQRHLPFQKPPPPATRDAVSERVADISDISEFIEFILSPEDITESNRGDSSESLCVEKMVRAHLTDILRDKSSASGIPILDFRHLRFPDITFSLDSPSLPPKRSRFYFFESPHENSLSNITIRLWPGNPPHPADTIRVCLRGRRGLLDRKASSFRSGRNLVGASPKL